MTKSATRQAREVVKTVWNPISWNQSQSVAKLASHGRTISAAKKTPRTVRITLRAPRGMGGSAAGAGRSKGRVMQVHLPLRGEATAFWCLASPSDYGLCGLRTNSHLRLLTKSALRSAAPPTPGSAARSTQASRHALVLSLGGDQDSAVGGFGPRSLGGRAALDYFH